MRTFFSTARSQSLRATAASALSWSSWAVAGNTSSNFFTGAGLDNDPFTVLAEFGGFEIATMVGAMLAAAEAKMVQLIDGFIVGSAALVASRLAPALLDYCVFCHRSAEAGHRTQLLAMGAEPLLDLGLRLGEGTGAALAYPLVQAAVNFLNDMASFESAGVSDKE